MQIDNFNGDSSAVPVVPAFEDLAGVTTSQLLTDVIAVVLDPYPEWVEAGSGGLAVRLHYYALFI